YFFFFSPVVLLYVAWEITTRRLWTNAHVLAAIAVTLAATLALTVPFLLPYLSVRQEGFTARSAAEVDRFSADVYSYLTAPANLHLWVGVARAGPKSDVAARAIVDGSMVQRTGRDLCNRHDLGHGDVLRHACAGEGPRHC